MSVINIEGINKARLLQALFNHSHQHGLGQLDGFVTVDGDEFDSRGYDRDNGEGAAEAVVAAIREDMAAEENAAAMEEAEKNDALSHTPVDSSPLDEVVDEPFDPLNESDKGVFLF